MICRQHSLASPVGYRPWSTQKKNQFLKDKDLQRFAQPELKQWRWYDSQFLKDGDKDKIKWGKQIVAMAGFTVENKTAKPETVEQDIDLDNYLKPGEIDHG